MAELANYVTLGATLVQLRDKHSTTRAMIGHAQPQWTLPEGVQVEIDATAGTITLLESAVA